MTDPVKVLVVDDHALFRRGIVEVLTDQPDIRIVGEAANGLEALAKVRQSRPDIILMDLSMPVCSGLECIQALQAESPQIAILVLTVSETDEDLFAATRFGARGYLLKNSEPDQLVQAIYHIAQGGAVLSPIMATKLIGEFADLSSRMGKEPESIGLSPREKEVLQQLAQGSTNKDIADLLFISENTVKTHLRNIMEKLHLSNRSQAAAYAIKKGLISPSTNDPSPQT